MEIQPEIIVVKNENPTNETQLEGKSNFKSGNKHVKEVHIIFFCRKSAWICR